MDIKQLNNPLFNGRSNDASSVKQSKENVEGSTSASQAGVNTDRVTLTQSLSMVAELEQKMQGIDSSNAERIASLKAAIADGSYQVNSQKVAEKFLQSEQLFSKL